MDIEKIKPSTTSAVLACTLSFFSIEFLLFILNRQLFMTLDLIRLAGIGIGITASILMVNGLIISGFKHSDKPKDEIQSEKDEKMTWALTGAVTIILISLLSLFGHHYKISLSKAFWILFYVELGFLVISFIYVFKSQD